MIPETNEKILAMYQAVCSLIEEGCDIHKMKVADITTRAGIGKGTAYEYFRSKDELLIKALQYDFYTTYQLLEKELKKTTTFREAVEAAFRWIEQNMKQKRMALQCLKILEEFREKDGNCVKEKMEQNAELFAKLLDDMIETGMEEGCISRQVPRKLVQLELGSKFVGYYLFFKAEEPGTEEAGQMKAFLYENMVKSLR